jgi:hypothetical protein
MHDIGGLVWIILVLIGVISSVVRNARKAAAARATQPAAQRQSARPAAPPAMDTQALTLRRLQAMAEDAEVPPVVPPPPSKPLPAAVPQSAIVTPLRAVAPTPSPVRGMFGSGESLARAFVASQVFGKPVALQEQSVWSPRHSEPSI